MRFIRRSLVKLCRAYQSCFRADNSEETRLIELHENRDRESFLRAYFEHEIRKGAEYLKRFRPYDEGWERQTVLDFGCGGGGMTYHLAGYFREALGVDIEEAARRGRNNVRFLPSRPGPLPFDESSIDVILCVDVVEHLPDLDFFVSEFVRILRPSGQLLLSFGPPWYHPHGKHMWTRIPGWWTHLLFPRSIVMEVRGYDPGTTWEDIGIHRLSVGKFERVVGRSGLETISLNYSIKSKVRLLRNVPLLRELFISEVVGIFRKPAEIPGRRRVPVMGAESER